MRGSFVVASLENSDDTIGAMTEVCQHWSALKLEDVKIIVLNEVLLP